MVSKFSFLILADNSGGRFFKCIALKRLYKSVCAGFIIKGVIKKLRKKRRSFSRVKKGSFYNGLVIQSRSILIRKNGKKFFSSKNLIIILGKENEPLATRIFNGVPKEARKKKKSKLLIMAPFIY